MEIFSAASASLQQHAAALTDPIPNLSSLIAHLLSTPVHKEYFPFPQFLVVHAAKVALVWAIMTRGKPRKDVGVLGDAFGYLVLAWGGGTITSILLGQPPSWLISPAPWTVYPLAYALLIPTGMASYVTRTAPALFLNLVFAAIDGLTRGTTIAALAPALVSARVVSTGWTYTLLSGIAVSGGGFIVSLLSLHEPKWTLGKPSLLDGGILNTLDCWGAMLVAAVYSSLLRLHPELDVFATRILPWIPAKLVTLGPTEEQPAAAVHPEAGRAVCVLLLGILLASRAVIQAVMPKHTGVPNKNKKKEPVIVQKQEVTVVKSPAKPERTKVTPRKSTPSKSPKPKPKSK